MKKMKVIMTLTATALLVASFTACAQPVAAPTQASVLQSEKPRITSPSIP